MPPGTPRVQAGSYRACRFYREHQADNRLRVFKQSFKIYNRDRHPPQTEKDNPGKQFFLLSPGFVCPNMKKTTLKSVYEALRDMKHDIVMDEELIIKQSYHLKMLKWTSERRNHNWANTGIYRL